MYIWLWLFFDESEKVASSAHPLGPALREALDSEYNPRTTETSVLQDSSASARHLSEGSGQRPMMKALKNSTDNACRLSDQQRGKLAWGRQSISAIKNPGKAGQMQDTAVMLHAGTDARTADEDE